MGLRLSPLLTSAFLLAASSTISVAEGAKTLSLALLSPTENTGKVITKPEYVDLHAVLLIDVSPSMKPLEIERSREGLFTYLLSDEAKQDYANGTSKAVTLVYFASTPYATNTRIISSLEDAQRLIDNYLHVVSSNKPSSITRLSNDESLGTGTDVYKALKKVGSVFDSESDNSYFTERRVVVVIGDYVPNLQKAYSREESDSLTKNYGARVCAVAVHDEGTEPPAYEYLVTRNDPLTQKPFKFVNEYGQSVDVRPCDTNTAKKPKDVEIAVSQALGMHRN
jgi:hypothetical protein